MPSRDGSVHHLRVFPLATRPQEEAELRSNENYDKVMKLKNPTEDQRKGYLGECALRLLKYFDVGRSFLTDSLHNLYGGAMVSDSNHIWTRYIEPRITIETLH